MRYINVTLIDKNGTATSAQIMAKEYREALEYMESEMSARDGRGRFRLPLIAAFIYDTRDKKLTQYIIDGLRAVVVTKELFK